MTTRTGPWMTNGGGGPLHEHKVKKQPLAKKTNDRPKPRKTAKKAKR